MYFDKEFHDYGVKKIFGKRKGVEIVASPGLDGVFGTASVQAMQRHLNTMIRAGLSVDGVWGAGATLQFIVIEWARATLAFDLSKAAILQGVTNAYFIASEGSLTSPEEFSASNPVGRVRTPPLRRRVAGSGRCRRESPS